MHDDSMFMTECDLAPRLNDLADFFAETAAGRGGMPMRDPVVDTRLLPNDALLHQLVSLHARRQGFFDRHYHASIPYRLEEECRMAHALMRFAQTTPEELSIYSLGTAEATMARTLCEIGQGKIRSLACSPNEENHQCFMAFGEPPNAEFFVGPFHRLTKEHLRGDERLARFSDGFDIIFEDTTFQMYSPNRIDQIGHVARHLKDGGIFLFLEKFLAADPRDYEAREAQKDHGFKTRYFATKEIERKSKTVLTTMRDCEVTLADMSNAVYAHFRHCVVTWNSGNFYGLAASNSEDSLKRYVSYLVPPAIPFEYVYGPGHFTELSRLARR